VTTVAATSQAVEYLRSLGIEVGSETHADDTVVLRWKGPGPVVAWVLARFGLDASVPPESDQGTARVATGACSSDLHRLARAFAELRERGYVAEGSLAFTASDGWGRIEAAQGAHARAVFWNWQAHADAFDAEGALIDELHLQWAGSPDEIAAALRNEGFEVQVPATSDETFVVMASMGAADRGTFSDDELLSAVTEGLRDGWKDDVRGGQLWRRWERDGRTVLVSAMEGDIVVVRQTGSDTATLYATPRAPRDVVAAVESSLDSIVADGLEPLASTLRAEGIDVTTRGMGSSA
jgi:hypothetical protein